MGLLDERQSKQNLEVVGNGVITKKDVINAGLHIVICDEEGCLKAAVLVMGDDSKCDDHDKPYLLQRFMSEGEKKDFIRKIVLDIGR